MPKGKKTQAQAMKECAKSGREIAWSNDDGVWHCATDLWNTPMWAKTVIEAATGVQYAIQDGLWTPIK